MNWILSWRLPSRTVSYEKVSGWGYALLSKFKVYIISLCLWQWMQNCNWCSAQLLQKTCQASRMISSCLWGGFFFFFQAQSVFIVLFYWGELNEQKYGLHFVLWDCSQRKQQPTPPHNPLPFLWMTIICLDLLSPWVQTWRTQTKMKDTLQSLTSPTWICSVQKQSLSLCVSV